MKKVYLLLFALCVATIAFAQVPKQMNYQGVARDANNQPLPNRAITLRLSILDNSSATTSLYSEVFAPPFANTNAMGLFTVKIGTGTSKTGNFDAINWGTGERYLKTEIDINGGQNYTTAGFPIQFVAVPYALVADTALRAPRASITGIAAGGELVGTYPDPRVAKLLNRPLGTTLPTTGQVLGFNGTEWTPTTPTTGGTTYTAGNGITIQNNTISANIPTALPPNGAASGDLSGTYPNPTVTKLRGIEIDAIPPTFPSVLYYNNSKWQPTTIDNISGWYVQHPFISTTSNQVVMGNANDKVGRVNISYGGSLTQASLFIRHSGTSNALDIFTENTNSTDATFNITNRGRASSILIRDEGQPSVNTPIIQISNTNQKEYIGTSVGAKLTSTGVWTSVSDRNFKSNISEFSGKAVLDKLEQLNIYKWSYKIRPDIFHIGAMAQDFYKVFEVGYDDKSITTIDPSGVALAGVKALHEQVKTQQTEIEQLKAQNADLLKRLIELEKKIK